MTLPADAPILTAAQMRAAEEAAFAAGLPQDDAMERAGTAVAREAARFAMGRRVLVVAGPGNNGGDAYVAARHLRAAGLDVIIAALGEAKRGSAARMRTRWDGKVVPLAEARPRGLLVDGLFGTGMTRALDSEVAQQLQHLVASADFTLSLDLPSGIGTDDAADFGAPKGIDATVALAALKPAHVLAAGKARAGHVLLADIGIAAETQWRSIARPRAFAPPSDAHKYTRGLVVVVQGAMPGAGRLAARAAIAGGAGYVILAGATPDSGGPDALVRRHVADGAALAKLLDDERIAAVVIGPGLGRDDHARGLLDAALASPHALVVDGDALSMLGHSIADHSGRGGLWLTPHAGEFITLFGTGPGSKIANTLAAAALANATVVHKGPETVIARGDAVRVLADAPSWLSTAGTGDVLAGLIAARHAAGGATAAVEAAWLHARAARLAGPAFAADDLVAQLPRALDECL